MKKYFAALIAAVMLLTGCSGDPGQPSSTVFNGPWDQPSRISDSGGESSQTSGSSAEDPGGSDVSGSDPKTEDPKPDIGNTARNVWLFGKKIPLPCRFEEFGEDFSLGEEHFYELKDDLIAFLCYKGEIIGEVILDECTKDDPNKPAKRVIQLALGDAEEYPVKTDGWYSKEIYLDVLGITMNSTPDDVRKVLGEPTSESGSKAKRLIIYKEEDGKYIEFTFKNNEMVEFVITNKGNND